MEGKGEKKDTISESMERGENWRGKWLGGGIKMKNRTKGLFPKQ